MTCEPFTISDGTFGIMCHRGTRTGRPECHIGDCHAPGDFLCDWPKPGGGTCDKPICEDHRYSAGPDKDWCPKHRAEAERNAPQLGLPGLEALP